MDLWRKESKKKGALYVNIFNNPRYDQKWLTQTHQDILRNIETYKSKHPWIKSDIIAVEKRKIGNGLFAQAKYREAMEQYNKSLCFAENKSENISLGYGNRSACYFHMEMYDKCLIDIELAKKADYPQRLMEKLNKRRIESEKLIGKCVADPKPKLSFEPSKQIPVFANSIKIEPNDRDGHRLIATTDLHVGETIFLEPSYVGESYAEKYLACNICLNLNENLIPCTKCTVAMFCHDKCENNDFHKIECDIKQCSIVTHSHSMNFRIPVIRSILMAIRAFSTIEALIEFVEQTMASGSPGIPSFNDDKSKYKTFLKLNGDTASTHVYEPIAYSLYQTMLHQTNIAEMFSTEKFKRFLMHLVFQHLFILASNSTNVSRTIRDALNPQDIAMATVALQLCVLRSFFKHACARNIALIVDNGSTAGIVVRPIKKGEQLFISQSDILPESYSERKQYLWTCFGIRCNCELCELRSNELPEIHFLRSNFDFQYIFKSGRGPRDLYTDDEAERLREKCKSFLEQFGSCKWCKEIDWVVGFYIRMLPTRTVTIDPLLMEEIKDQSINWPTC